MDSMVEMAKDAESLSLSSILKSAAVGLQKLLEGKQREPYEKEGMNYAGNLIGQIDWYSKHYNQPGSLEMVLEATRLRPLFMKKMDELGIPLQDYSEKAYRLLTTQTYENSELSREEACKVQRLFNDISDEILSALQYASDMSDPD